MAEPLTLVELVVDIHGRLDDARIDHALSGALAFAYDGDPRGTLDGDTVDAPAGRSAPADGAGGEGRVTTRGGGG